MKYIRVKWKHTTNIDPIWIYSEIDNEQWEHRKVEIFLDGRKGFADKFEQIGGSQLGLEPWPDLVKLGSEPEFEIAEISKEDFEKIWNIRKI